jgi:hypothetical protein
MGNPTPIGAPRVPPSRNSLAAHFARLTREQLAEIADVAIQCLDDADGDSDVEANGDELDGTAGEDDFYPHSGWFGAAGCPISDPGGDTTDEHGEADESAGLLLPVYGEDQTLGPINEREMIRDRHMKLMAS